MPFHDFVFNFHNKEFFEQKVRENKTNISYLEDNSLVYNYEALPKCKERFKSLPDLPFELLHVYSEKSDKRGVDSRNYAFLLNDRIAIFNVCYESYTLSKEYYQYDDETDMFIFDFQQSDWKKNSEFDLLYDGIIRYEKQYGPKRLRLISENKSISIYR